VKQYNPCSFYSTMQGFVLVLGKLLAHTPLALGANLWQCILGSGVLCNQNRNPELNFLILVQDLDTVHPSKLSNKRLAWLKQVKFMHTSFTSLTSSKVRINLKICLQSSQPKP
jgi:hypothetical protein